MSLSNLNPFAISGLLIVITYTPLFLLILIKGKTALTRIFSLHILSVLLWGLGAFLIGINKNPEIALDIWIFGYIAVIFIPVFFYHSLFFLLKKNMNIFVVFAYAQAFYFSFASITKKAFPTIRLCFDSFYCVNGTIQFLASFIIWSIIVSIAHVQLINYYKNTYPKEKKQISFLILAMIGFAGGVLNFLPALGFDVYPYGNFLIPFHSFFISYAILKHQLLHIDIVFKKSAIYSFLIAIISLAYLLIVILLEKLLQGFLGYHSILISIFTAFGFGLVFVPLHKKIQHGIDMVFFKGSQEEIARQNELLREQVAQTERLKTVATLASGIAHEVKNPLTAIKIFTEHLPQKMDDKEFLDKFSRIVGKEVDRIDGLVHQLLDFAKPNPLTLSDVDIKKFLEETLEFMSHHFIKSHIKVIKNLSETPMIRADINQLRQAFLNIFLNAIDAMPSGGTLTIQVEGTGHGDQGLEQNPKPYTLPPNPSMRISITDTGPGIPEKDLKHIFDPFFTTKGHGTGLGLSITQRIIQGHNGKIFAESEMGKGTTMRIEMKMWEEEIKESET